MLRWTKMSPGMEAVMTDSGTRESEQPIQSTCERQTGVSATSEGFHSIMKGTWVLWQAPEKSAIRAYGEEEDGGE